MNHLRILTYTFFSFILLLFACENKNDLNPAISSSEEVDKRMDEALNLIENNDFEGCISKYTECLDYYKAHKDTANMSECYFQMSSAYHRLGNFKMSIEMALECLHLDSCLNNIENMSSTYNNIAAIYLSTKDLVSARTFITKAIELEEQTENQSYLSIRYGMASEIYTKSDSAELGYDYAIKAYELDKEKNDSIKMGKRLSEMGDALVSMKRLDEAEAKYLEAETCLSSDEGVISLCINYKQMGLLYKLKGDTKKAIASHEKSLDLARGYKLNYLIENNLSSLAKLYESIDKNKALEYAHDDMSMKDSIYTQEIHQATQQFAAQYNLWEKQKQIRKQENKLHIQRIIILSLLTTFILLLLLSWLYFYMRYMRKEKRELHIKYSHALITDLSSPTSSPEAKSVHNGIDYTTENDRKFLLKVNEIINSHIDEASLSSVKISEEICLGQRQVNRKIKAITGIDTSSYIKMKRINKAKQLLDEKKMTIGEIQSSCGFESPSYFSKVFKDVVGITPSEYRKKY